MNNEYFEREKLSAVEEAFQYYLDDLGLMPGDVNKVILYVGVDNTYFARWIKDHNMSSQIYSLEPFHEMLETEKALVGFAEEIPILDKSFDLIVSIGAIPNIYLGDGEVKEKIQENFSEMLQVLRDRREILLARVLADSTYPYQKIFTQNLQEALKTLEENNITLEKIRTPENDLYKHENNIKTDLLTASFIMV
jgi:hypothetical protein